MTTLFSAGDPLRRDQVLAVKPDLRRERNHLVHALARLLLKPRLVEADLRRSKVLAAREVVPPPKRGDVPLVHGDGRLKATCLRLGKVGEFRKHFAEEGDSV